MAGLDVLIPHIYHEKQQEGSMLCAQHALNSLLQGDYFSAADLSSLGRTLDTMEQGVMEGDRQGRSTNMDDTGFFSVQVLEEALHVWGLSLVRWRSEIMRPYQDQPHNQLAFVLNLSQHWFTLRRFGSLSPDPEVNEHTNGHWFNLNSYLQNPEWVSKTYLGMVISQAETEGYSVFAVVQTDPEAPLTLPRTQADDIASTLPEPSSSSTSNAARAQASYDFGDEDYELQAALQASLGGYDELPPVTPQRSQSGPSTGPPVIPFVGGPHDRIIGSGSSRLLSPGRGLSLGSFEMNRGSSESNTGLLPPLEAASDDEDEEEEFVDAPSHPIDQSGLQEEVNDDPVQASMARQRRMLERMRREQEVALQEQYEDETAGFANPARIARRREEEEEAEMLRRAIAESEAEAREREGAAGRQRAIGNDEVMDVAPSHDTRRPWESAANRVYDDDDAELQAALKASLETVPADFKVPDTPPGPSIPLSSVPASSANIGSSGVQHEEETDETSMAGTETDTEPDDVTDEPMKEEEDVSVEEMRRRRLARFGAT